MVITNEHHWASTLDKLQNICMSNDASCSFELTSQRTFYVSIEVFGEPDKRIITTDYSTREAAIDVALTEVLKWE